MLSLLFAIPSLFIFAISSRVYLQSTPTMSTFRSAILLAFSLTARIACAENNASVRIPAFFNPTVAGLNRVQYQLGPQLSPAAKIYLPGNAFYGNATTRWNGAMHPDFAAVVVPINNEDVATAVSHRPIAGSNTMLMPRNRSDTRIKRVCLF